MLTLFIATFLASIVFILAFLWKLPEDNKTGSIRSLFFLLFALGFWIATLPAMFAPENPSIISHPSYNVIVYNSVDLNPINVISANNYQAYTQNVLSSISIKTYYAYFWLWVVVFAFLLFVIFIWYVNLLRKKAIEAVHEGADVMQQYESKHSIEK